MKKVLVAVTIVAILGVAGAAAAKHRNWDRRADGWGGRQGYGASRYYERGFQNDDRYYDRGPGGRHGAGRRGGMHHEGWGPDARHHGGRWGEGRGPGFGPMGFNGNEWMTQNAPDEIRAKMTELAKLRIDMRDALTRNPVDRARATEIHGKMTTLMQDVGTWRFNRRLDIIEQRRKEMELNRKIPIEAPSPAAPGDKAPGKP